MSEGQNGRPAATRRTVIDEGTEIDGGLNSSCPILVVGRVQGNVTGPAVEVAEQGAVLGKIKVGELRSRGEIGGEIDADHVDLGGKVRDATVIRARSLEVTLGRRRGEAEMEFGDCDLHIGDEPDEQKAVADALAAGKPRPPAARVAVEAAVGDTSESTLLQTSSELPALVVPPEA